MGDDVTGALSGDVQALLEALAHAPSWPTEGPVRVRPGDQIGRYTLDRLLGRGPSGAVFAARDPQLGRRVALKVTRGIPAAGELARFEREARAAGTIIHPALVALYDVGTIQGLPFVVTELVEDETLAARLSRGPLAVEAALVIAADLADAVARMHAQGILHLDLEPHNVVVSRDGRARVLDFGLAQLHGGRAATPRYAAPELSHGAPADPRNDIYALGVIVLEMITGDDRGPVALKLAPMRERGTIARMLALEPARRFRDGGELRDALVALATPNRFGRRLVLVGALVGAALAAGVVALATREPRAPASDPLLAEHVARDALAVETRLRATRREPLHATRGDDARARVELATLAIELGAPGKSSTAAAQLALAHAEHAVHALAAARTRLEALHDRTPAVGIELGLVLLDQYRDELAAGRRVDHSATHRQRDARLALDLRDPALRMLHDAKPAAPLVLARIAIFEDRFADAVALVRRVPAADPTAFEAAALLGDAFERRAETQRDPALALADHERAGEGRAAALAIAPSDPGVLEAECRRRVFLLEVVHGERAAHELAAATAACERAAIARPHDADVRVDEANNYLAYANAESTTGRDLEPMLREARGFVERAMAEHPDEYSLAYAAGTLARLAAYVDTNRGGDPRNNLVAAERAFERARVLRPDGEAKQLLGIIEALRAEDAIARGDDPTAAVVRTGELLAVEGTPEQVMALGRALVAGATWDSQHGRDPSVALDRAIAAFAAARIHAPEKTAIIDEQAGAWQAKAEWLERSGGDPIPALDRAIGYSEAMLAPDPDDLVGNANLGYELVARAAAEVERGGDGAPLLARALGHLDRAHAIDPKGEPAIVNLALAREVAVRIAIAAHRDGQPAVAAARTAIAAVRAVAPDEPLVLTIECDLARDEAALAGPPARAAAWKRADEACRRALASAPDDPLLARKLAAIARQLAP